MASFVVMTQPGPESSSPEGPRAIFVRDGFTFLAFLVPWLWLLSRRLWIEALVVIALLVAVTAFGAYLDRPLAASILSLGLSILIGLEAPAIRIAALRRRGYEEWGVVDAENDDEAETRFIVELDEQGDLARPAPPVTMELVGATRLPAREPAAGLLLPGLR